MATYPLKPKNPGHRKDYPNGYKRDWSKRRRHSRVDFNKMTTEETQMHFEEIRATTVAPTQQAEMLEGKALRKALEPMETFSIDTSEKKLMTILTREIDHLMKASYVRKLDKDEASALASYIRLTKEFRKVEAETIEGMSDEELEAIAAQNSGK